MRLITDSSFRDFCHSNWVYEYVQRTWINVAWRKRKKQRFERTFLSLFARRTDERLWILWIFMCVAQCCCIALIWEVLKRVRRFVVILIPILFETFFLLFLLKRAQKQSLSLYNIDLDMWVLWCAVCCVLCVVSNF